MLRKYVLSYSFSRGMKLAVKSVAVGARPGGNDYTCLSSIYRAQTIVSLYSVTCPSRQWAVMGTFGPRSLLSHLATALEGRPEHGRTVSPSICG